MAGFESDVGPAFAKVLLGLRVSDSPERTERFEAMKGNSGSKTAEAYVFDPASARTVELKEAQWELIEICVRATQALGLPRSVGEIFGFLFTSETAVSFDQVVTGVGISAGSVSHGLRYLRRLGAVKLVLHARDRRDFYTVETALRNLITGAASEAILANLEKVIDRLQKLKTRIPAEDPTANIIADRADILLDWGEQAKAALAQALGALR
jgi:DNA-binding transcriptional regulator GbsR (MarR family)